MDNDLTGHEAAEKFSEKLGHRRCTIINSEVLELKEIPKNACQAMK